MALLNFFFSKVVIILPDSSVGKESNCNAGDLGSIPGSEREGLVYPLQYSWTSLVAQLVKNPHAIWEAWVWSLGWVDPLEKRAATHSSILAWRISWKSMGSQRVRHEWAIFIFTFHNIYLAGWHHRLDGHESEWTPEAGDGQRGLACCQFMGSQRVGHDWVTELNWTELTSRWLTHLYLLPWLLRYILEYSSWISLWYHTQKTSISERWTLGFCSPTYLCHLVASLPTTGLQWKAFIYCLYLNLPSSKSSNSDSKLCILSILKINSAIGLQRTLLTRSKKSNLYPFTQQPEWLFFFLMGKDFTCTKHL